jgi:general secretion pathway protein D
MSRTNLIMLSLLAILALFALVPMAFSQNPVAGSRTAGGREVTRGLPRSEPAQVRVVTLKNAVANNVSGVLRDLFRLGLTGPITFVPDSRTNSLLISANEKDLETLEDLIATLDRKLTAQTGKARYKPETSVMVLKNRKAEAVERVLSNLYERHSRNVKAGTTGSSSGTVRIVIDFELNAVIAQAAPETMKDIKTLLTQLDIPLK